MRFNNYIWDLYLNSKSGRETVERWAPSAKFPDEVYALQADPIIYENFRKNGMIKYLADKNKINWHSLLADHFKHKNLSNDTGRKTYQDMVIKGVKINGLDVIKAEDYRLWTIEINIISTALYNIFPDYFFPYDFKNFNQLTEITREFKIPLPQPPKKINWNKRAIYYIAICDALLEFRQLHKFTPSELCAFLYDFAPKTIEEKDAEKLPNPSKAWFVGGSKYDFSFLDNATADSQHYWQGNIDSKEGDIAVMYCLSPRSYIHSIWRVIEDGFIDPFFNYYNAIKIGHPIILDKKVTKTEIDNNPIWSNNSLVRKNLQGINGYPVKYIEYLELLSILSTNGVDIQNYPQISKTNRLDADELIDERDVERRLIEPFLKLLNYKEDEWIRQMPVKIGTSTRYYPDYCFYAIPLRGEESAKMILESKFEIKTQKDLREAYYQAKSYALRLQSSKFIIASKEGIWIYEPIDKVYRFDNYKHYNWLEVENPDILYSLKQRIGKVRWLV